MSLEPGNEAKLGLVDEAAACGIMCGRPRPSEACARARVVWRDVDGTGEALCVGGALPDTMGRSSEAVCSCLNEGREYSPVVRLEPYGGSVLRKSSCGTAGSSLSKLKLFGRSRNPSSPAPYCDVRVRFEDPDMVGVLGLLHSGSEKK